MNILIIGSGGREHALAMKVASSPRAKNTFVAPGNPGMQLDTAIKTLDVNLDDFNDVYRLCTDYQIDLVIIGPEKPLSEGLVDFLNEREIKTFGPNKVASQVESSKAFSKKIMQKYGIPTARYKEFVGAKKAVDYIDQLKDWDGIVVKNDGLAAGKGVIVCDNAHEAKIATLDIMLGRHDGNVAKKIILEERLKGAELSAFALVNGDHFEVIGHACDYKRIRDNDQGPNTGGMGTYSPVPWLSQSDKTYIHDHIFKPFIVGLKAEGIFFQGVLFAGLMKDGDKINTLEFNCRFGDPETQVILPLLENDFIELIENLENKTKSHILIKDAAAVHVVKAAHGYPGTEGIPVRKGDRITIHQKINQNTQFVFAGVKTDVDDELYTNSGRVLGVTCIGESIQKARSLSYSELKNITFEGEQYRNDIAQL